MVTKGHWFVSNIQGHGVAKNAVVWENAFGLSRLDAMNSIFLQEATRLEANLTSAKSQEYTSKKKIKGIQKEIPLSTEKAFEPSEKAEYVYRCTTTITTYPEQKLMDKPPNRVPNHPTTFSLLSSMRAEAIDNWNWGPQRCTQT